MNSAKYWQNKANTHFKYCQESECWGYFSRVKQNIYQNNRRSNNIMKTKIFHNPRCSKSRQTLELLNNKGIETEIVDYLTTPPDVATLEKILQGLGMEPRELMRKNQDEYKTLGLNNENLSRAELIQAMIENPILIERPIVITDKGIAIGRPIENVEKILSK